METWNQRLKARPLLCHCITFSQAFNSFYIDGLLLFTRWGTFYLGASEMSRYFNKIPTIPLTVLQRAQLLLLLDKKHICMNNTSTYFLICAQTFALFGNLAHISLCLPPILFNCIGIAFVVFGYMFFLLCYKLNFPCGQLGGLMWCFCNYITFWYSSYKGRKIVSIYNPNFALTARKLWGKQQNGRHVVSLQQQQCDVQDTLVSVLWSVIVGE